MVLQKLPERAAEALTARSASDVRNSSTRACAIWTCIFSVNFVNDLAGTNMQRVLFFVLVTLVVVVSTDDDKEPCFPCDDEEVNFNEPRLIFDPFGCNKFKGQCAPEHHSYYYSLEIVTSDLCVNAVHDTSVMTKMLKSPGKRHVGYSNSNIDHFSRLDAYGRAASLSQADVCMTREDRKCPVSFHYSAPHGYIQAGCHYRNGTLYKTIVDGKKLNDFFNSIRL